jgi:transcriptional regulator with XRE-family HTH domain
MIDPLDTLDPSTLGAARKARRLTLAQLADAAGVAPSTVMRIEKGAHPGFGKWQRIVTAFNRFPVVSSSTPRNPPAA